MATPFADAVTLTPVRVKKVRPSLSSTKSPMEPKPKIRALSEVLNQKPRISPTAEYDRATAALNFREFSFWNEKGNLSNRNISDQSRKALHSYLAENYGVTAMTVSLPFLILECAPDAPPEDERPFSVAGAISVWVKEGQFEDFSAIVGERGDGERLTLPEELANDLQQMRNPSPETLLVIANAYFPKAIAISYIWDGIVVELPKVGGNQFLDLLGELPECFTNANVNLGYHNGVLPFTERKRLVKPDATYIDGPKSVSDETDYVKQNGCFYPGSMIHAVDANGQDIGSVSAGILVEKSSMRRLTVSHHCWESLIEKDPEKFGSPDSDFCKILQGQPGTKVGFVHERINLTDIALAKLLPSVEFRNAFMEIETTAKRLLPSREIDIGDDFLIDSFVTGKQRLRCMGVRYPLERKENARSHPELLGPENLLPLDRNLYIKMRQGVYASNQEKIPGQVKIRAGVCGAVLLRCSLNSDRSRSVDSVLKDGKVGGIMHFADLRTKGDVNTLLCYADSFNELLAAGWKVVPTAEKRTERSDDDGEGEPATRAEKRSK